MTERLEKLVLMLSSDNDGEVVNAARAIGRELKVAGRDWHWLARRVAGGVEVSAAFNDARAASTGPYRSPFTAAGSERPWEPRRHGGFYDQSRANYRTETVEDFSVSDQVALTRAWSYRAHATSLEDTFLQNLRRRTQASGASISRNERQLLHLLADQLSAKEREKAP